MINPSWTTLVLYTSRTMGGSFTPPLEMILPRAVEFLEMIKFWQGTWKKSHQVLKFAKSVKICPFLGIFCRFLTKLPNRIFYFKALCEVLLLGNKIKKVSFMIYFLTLKVSSRTVWYVQETRKKSAIAFIVLAQSSCKILMFFIFKKPINRLLGSKRVKDIYV